MKWSLLAIGLVVVVLLVGLVMSMRQPVEVPIASAPRSGLFGGPSSSEKARQSACMSNIKQLSMAALMYCQDYNEVMVPHARWTASLYPYMKNRQLFVCPSAPQLPIGYAYHKALSFKPLGKIARPAETPMLADSDVGGNNPADLLDLSRLPPRHSGGANVGFTDGHVKWYQPTGHYP